ncbi:hypothetical protein [Labilithrix luteola]|nr:hypothetical protein [Labilithrix luteola]
MRVSRSDGLAASAMIVDDAGAVVAQRTVTDRSARTCVPLARAVGAWASLVLDDEIDRTDEPPAEPPPAVPSVPKIATSSRVDAGSVDSFPPLEGDSTSSTPKQRTVDIGATAFFRTEGPARYGVAGVAPFVSVKVSRSWHLRPGLAFGRYFGARVDLCWRIPGNYIERRGLEFDLCGGVDGGVASQGDELSARMSTGPSVILRGELAYGIALELRGVSGLNWIRPSGSSQAPTPSLLAMTGEVGLSMRFQ